MSDKIWELIEAAGIALSPFLPPFLGSLVGLRWSDGATRRDRVWSWGSSFVLGVVGGGAAAEYFELGPKLTIAAGFMIAVVGAEFLAILIVVLRDALKDPAAAFVKWRDIVMFRRSQS